MEPETPSSPEVDLKRDDSLRNVNKNKSFLTDRESIVSRSTKGSRKNKMLRIKKKAIMESQNQMKAKYGKGLSRTFVGERKMDDILATINESNMNS